VGIVATSNIQHATPAAYCAHTTDRRDYQDIAKQQVYQNMDVVLGGGKKYLLPRSRGGTRPDPEDLTEVLKRKGYALIQTREELLRFEGKKVWGLFADNDLAYEWDRRLLRPEEPSLAEMTRAAIRILSQNGKGFFLFIEGSKIDWASHAHDPIGVISDLLAFDEAVGVALDFAQRDGRTLLLAFADHGNGGMSLGSRFSDKTYHRLPLESLLVPLRKALLTGEGLERVLGENPSSEKIIQTLKDFYGLSDLRTEEIAAIQKAPKGRLNAVVGPMLSQRTPIGWTTSGHTGEDLFFYAYGPHRPIGLLENTEIAHLCARNFQFDLFFVDRRLFSPAEEVFQDLGARLRVDESIPTERALIVEKGDLQARFPFSQNTLRVGDRVLEMEGLTVWAPKIQKAFLPREAFHLLRQMGF
jgi:alkaline phosphatase